MAKTPRIVLLHATPVAIEPVRLALREAWPEAEPVNLLDDSLSPDRAQMADLSPAMIERFVALGRYAETIGADGILVTCSAFGPAIEALAAAAQVPVLKPNEAMFRAAIAGGRRIGMLATFAPSVSTMEAEFADFVAATGSAATLTTVLVEGAMDALRRGDVATHNRLVAESAAALAACDTIMLAHFSTSNAAPLVRQHSAVPVLSSPSSAVLRMRELIEGR